MIADLAFGVVCGVSIGFGAGVWFSRHRVTVMNRAFLGACEQADLAARMPGFIGIRASDERVIKVLSYIERDLNKLNGTRGNVERVGIVCTDNLHRIRQLREATTPQEP